MFNDLTFILKHVLNPAVLAEFQAAHSVALKHPVAGQFFFHFLNHALGGEWVSASKTLERLFLIKNPSLHTAIAVGKQPRLEVDRLFRAGVLTESTLNAVPLDK